MTWMRRAIVVVALLAGLLWMAAGALNAPHHIADIIPAVLDHAHW